MQEELFDANDLTKGDLKKKLKVKYIKMSILQKMKEGEGCSCSRLK